MDLGMAEAQRLHSQDVHIIVVTLQRKIFASVQFGKYSTGISNNFHSMEIFRMGQEFAKISNVN